ncbi:vanadium-dependent haloperoxidase [Rossellomorea yichunensis]|uniref:vanadium-dependent haloperoxidase n=1 Tax=Rossellomorea yichunensis TaxID=3077331 RepID=UPI0028DDB278|nr:vanadium-dependent haloperoxidase [Rossellomorea sp. YC4-1]MDT9027493.1 vanadium-dependent haloperoxidase [Rossellomorea sp. YC4-1]
MSEDYLCWTEIPYAGEVTSPTDPVTPEAGLWSLIFLKRDKQGSYLDPIGRKLRLPIKHPSFIDFEKELRIVQNTLNQLTPYEKNIANYYGTGVPTKQWTPVIDRLIDTYDVTPTYAARILAAVQAAINDTLIVVWDLKYEWDVARPNQYDQTLETFICTPRFPTYPSGHATMSGCAEVVLSYFFPKEAKKLRKIADDNALSRLYAGVHFPSDNNEGLRLGRYIGTVIVNHLKTQRNSNLKPIDNPFRDFRNANIFSDDYQQFIPYDFPKTCTSLVMDKKKLSSGKDNNIHVPKPLLYL